MNIRTRTCQPRRTFPTLAVMSRASRSIATRPGLPAGGVVGRILVEAGTFADTPRGEKALAYFLAHPDEDLKMSHGYRYKSADRADGVYEWLEIVERSVLPGAAAANPWTQFLAKEVNMPLDETKRKALESVFGADEAAAIIAAAEQKTKELEGKGTAFKGGREGAPAQKVAPAERPA